MSDAATAFPRRARIEAPTMLLAIVIYSGWIATTLMWRALPWPLLVILGGWLTMWHSSLQHETIHGHPTRVRRINDAIGFPPLSLWLPYDIYRSSHLRHHNDENLTDPIEDPESAYVTADVWRRIGPVGQFVLNLNATLAGRLIIGPAIMIGTFLFSEARLLLAGDRTHWRIWGRHLLGAAPVLVWVVGVCGMPAWLYVIAFVYPAAALMRLRSYAEHRWADAVPHRSAVVEASWPFGLLYLNNNLHALHHARPNIPWYDLPQTYAHEQSEVGNGGLVYRGYGDVIRRFLVRQHDNPLHPRLGGDYSSRG
jgi:fatty acid desaturase